MPNATKHDIEITAKTIYGEARGESHEGQRAVAWAIRNRAAIGRAHPHFGDGSPAAACLAPWQFSSWNTNDPNAAVLHRMSADDPILAPFLEIARAVLTTETDDPTHGATYYYASSIKPPEWARGKTPCAVIGHHWFFRDIA